MSDKFKAAVENLFAELPPSGTFADFDKLEEAFNRHFPDAKQGTITLDEIDKIVRGMPPPPER